MQKLESALREFFQSWEGEAWWRPGFYRCSMSVPAYSFYSYAGVVSDSTILFTVFRDDPAENTAKALFDAAIRDNQLDAASIQYQKLPIPETRFDSYLLLPPSYSERFLNEADHLNPHTVECALVFDCEYTGAESRDQFQAFQRYISTIEPHREPNPQCSVRCSIPVADIQIPDWYTCPYSELESYLFVLADHRRGTFSVRNISGDVIDIDPRLEFEDNKRMVRQHLISI